jgi:hypothetical protein
VVRDRGAEAAFEKVKQMYVNTICGPDKETYFIMGNMRQHPDSFLVLGAFYPPLSASPTFCEFAEMDPATRIGLSPEPPAPASDPVLFSNNENA